MRKITYMDILYIICIYIWNIFYRII